MDNSVADKSLSDTDIAYHVTPPTFVSTRRIKRKRLADESTLDDFKEEIKSLISLISKDQKEGFDRNAIALAEIKQANLNIENSLSFLTAQNEEMRKKIEKLEGKVNEDRKYIITLEQKIESMQQDNRKSNFEIKNVPTVPNETKTDLVDMVISLSKTIGCEMTKSDIKDVYRVRSKRDAPKNMPIIVETSSTLLKNDILKLTKAFNVHTKSKLCAKHLGFRTSVDTPIYISSQLTAKGARLYFLARDLVKQKIYKYCWISYGKIYLRKTDDSAIILVTNEAQIEDMKKEIK